MPPRTQLSLVEGTRTVFAKATPDTYGLLQAWGEGVLNLRVSRDQLERALAIIAGVVAGVERLGGTVEASKDGTTLVHLDGQSLSVLLTERAARRPHELTPDDRASERRYGAALFTPKFDHSPSGELSFQIDEYGLDGCRKKWSDGPKRGPLDAQVEEIVVGLKQAVVAKAAWQRELARQRVARQEEERREDKARRRHEEASRNIAGLMKEVDDWDRSRRLRAFLATAKAAYEQQHGDVPVGSPFAQWLGWAAGVADGMDPIARVAAKTASLEPTTV